MSNERSFPDEDDIERARELVGVLEEAHERFTESPDASPERAEIRRALALARAQRDTLRDAAAGGASGPEPKPTSETLDVPLTDALRRLCVEFRPASQCEVDFRLGGSPGLEGKSAQVVYEVTRDLLEAFIDRGEADHVTVSLGEVDEVTVLSVSDEGTGFNPATVGPGQLKLRELRDRVDAIGGHVGWEASWEEGTRIEVHV